MYDLPGYGQSQQYQSSSGRDESAADNESEFQGDTSVKFQALALAELLKHVHMDGSSTNTQSNSNTTPAVIAHDIAGTIVLRAHLLHGCEFASMLLMDTNTVLPWGDGFYTLVRSEPGTFLKLPPDIFEAVVRAVTRSAFHDSEIVGGHWDDVLASPWTRVVDDAEAEVKQKQRSFVRQIAQANDADVAEMLGANMYSQVRCDVKVLWGESDRWIPKEKIEQLCVKLGDRMKECVFVPEAGHLVMVDQPARVAVEVFDWLNRY